MVKTSYTNRTNKTIIKAELEVAKEEITEKENELVIEEITILLRATASAQHHLHPKEPARSSIMP